jgi:hypothetical protein
MGSRIRQCKNASDFSAPGASLHILSSISLSSFRQGEEYLKDDGGWALSATVFMAQFSDPLQHTPLIG